MADVAAAGTGAEPYDKSAELISEVNGGRDPIEKDLDLKPWEIKDEDPRWKTLDDKGELKKLIVRDPDETDAPRPMDGDKVICDYSGFLRDGGKKFDSSRERDEPFKFQIGKGNVIKGWDVGIATMQIGEKAILRCAPDYAYGENGSPPSIPPNSTLDFVVQLHNLEQYEDIWDIDDAPGSIKKRTLKESEGWETPKESSTVTVDVVGKENDAKGRVFLELKDAQIELPYDLEFMGKGICEEYKYCRGFYKAISVIKKGETCQYKLTPTEQYTWGAAGCEEFKIAPNTGLFFEISLKDFSEVKQPWSIDDQNKLPHAKELKAKANGFFKKKKNELAKKLYKDCLDLADGIKDESEKELAKTVIIACHSNTALINFQANELGDAMESVKKGLELDKDHEKLLYRKAQILNKRAEYDEATKILTKLLEKSPDNKAVKNLMARNKKKAKEAQKKQRALAKKMFG